MNIVCNGSAICPKKLVKYLGAELDQTLSGESMAGKVLSGESMAGKVLSGESMSGKVLSKVYAQISFLYIKAKFLDCETRKLLASALFNATMTTLAAPGISALLRQQ